MVRNFTGLIFVMIGAFIFQIGYALLSEDMQEKFAKGLVRKIEKFV